MLFSPDAHEALADEPWSVDGARTAIASIVLDAESAFEDGWPTHPEDVDDDDDASTRFRTVYLGGAGVVDALCRYTLWTGDLGTALYLADCIEGGGELPLPQVIALRPARRRC